MRAKAAQLSPEGRRSRRRGTALEDAILEAAWQELVAVGYANVTMAAVAARARTNKATLYRRWSNRTELLAASVERHVPRLQERTFHGGNLRDDVIAILRTIAERAQTARKIPDPDGALASLLLDQAVRDGIEQLPLALGRAIERGELKHSPTNATIRLPVNVVHSELCLGSTPITKKRIDEIVDELFLPLARTSV